MMNNQKITLDQDKLQAMYGGDASFQHIVFEAFIEDIEPQIEDFEALVNQENWQEVGNAAHSMKPSFGMVGLPGAEANLKDIEQAVKKGMDPAQIKIMAQQFIALFPSLLEAVKEAFKDLGAA